jgi:PAS domain S-box-containing protein
MNTRGETIIGEDPVRRLREFLDHPTHEELLDRLDLALEGAGLGIWDWDLRDNAVQFDRRWCEMLGLDHVVTPMHLDTWRERVHPDDIDGCYRDIAAHIEGRTPRYENTHRMRHADGSWMHILDRGRISGRDADGRPVRFTGTHLDITQWVRARDAAARERETRVASLALFAGGVAHEINTPLQVVILEAEMLEQSLRAAGVNAPAVWVGLNNICETARRAGEITRALRTLARDARHDPSTRVVVHDVLRDVHALCRGRFRNAAVPLHFDDVGGDVAVRARPSEVLIMLMNLLHNALDAAAPSADPWVRLTVTTEGEAVVIRCLDSGAGVRDEDVPRLMDPFFTTKPTGAGTGLGLAITNTFATRNGGALRYLVGVTPTTFELSLPAEAEPG